MSIAIYNADGSLIANNGSNGISILGPDGALMPNNGSNGVSILDINGARQLADGVVDEYSILGTDGALKPYDAGNTYSILSPSGSLLHLGPELLVNGSFDTDTNWTKFAAWTISGGTAIVTNGSSNTAILQPGIVQVGKKYSVTFTIDSISSGDVKVFSTAMGYSGTARTAAGTYTEIITPTAGTNGNLSLVGNNNANAVVSSVSCREVF